MPTREFQRARSPEAKRLREATILDAARRLGAERGIRQVTLTDIAEAVGMHKSAMLRYFETREEIFLQLTAEGWQDWAPDLAGRARALERRDAGSVAGAGAASLAGRPVFCDLLAQTPLNLERNVSMEKVREFKPTTGEGLGAVGAALRAALPALTDDGGVDRVAAATSLAGTFYQIATPGPEVAELYRTDPRPGPALAQPEPRLTRILASMLRGRLAERAG